MKQISQRQMALLVGCGQSTLQRFEAHNHLAISLSAVIRLAEVLDVSLDYLCAGVVVPEPVKRITRVEIPAQPKQWFEV